MAQHSFPEALLQRIRQGRAALVVGPAVAALAGQPSWRAVIERLADELARRGEPGDEAAAADVRNLLGRDRLVSAMGFLARTLGGATCDRIIAEVWRTPEPLPEAIQVLGRLPFRAIWTVHPGDLVERAVALGSPEGWPAARVVSHETADTLDPRRRHVLKLLGDITRPDSYVLVPTSVRRALAPAAKVRSLLADLYRDGALVFVGFRVGDPDTHAILDRLLGTLELPEAQHYFAAGGLGPVDTAELEGEHHVRVTALDGDGADERTAAAIATYLGELAEACAAAGITLASGRPDDDDLEGWIAILAEDPSEPEARRAIAEMAERARAGNPERLVEVLLARIEIEEDPLLRSALLREVARTYETKVGDLPRAFTAFTAAVRENPADEDAIAEAERLAAETEGWGELVGDLAEIVPTIEDKEVAAGLWVRLGRWYHDELQHPDYAVASYREALKLQPAAREAREALEELYRRQQKWGELAEALSAHADALASVAPGAPTTPGDAGRRVDVLLALGDLYESQLASTQMAIDAYERALAADPTSDDALAALERLYRRGERWGKLASILEQRAERAGDPARAAVYRKELGQLRSEKLGDVEGAIARYEAAVETDPRDLDALRSLERLYERAGRTEDYLRTLERLAAASPESERGVLYRRLAAEVEDREGGAARAIRCYEQVLAVEPAAVDAYRSLERLLRATGDLEGLVRLHERHIGVTTEPAPRAELRVELGRVLETELADPHRAIEAHRAALADVPAHVGALEALGRLYRRVEEWGLAVRMLVRHAELAGPAGAPIWHDAAVVLATKLDDPAAAETRFAKALELDPGHVPSHLHLAELHRRRRDFARAARALLEAERHTANRLDKVRLLHQAAVLHEESLDQGDVAADLYARVLALDPDHVDAGVRVVDRWLAAGRFADAEPVLEMLLRKLEPEDKAGRARRAAQLGRCAEALGHLDKAARHYRSAVEADADSLDAALGLANVLYAREEWEEADRRYRELIVRHRSALPEGQVVELWHRIGVAARARGDAKGAEGAFRRALERDPGHRASLRHVVELAAERGDFRAVVEAKRSALEGASEEERWKLLCEIGDLHAGKLEDPVTALGAYLEARKLRPRDQGLLHKILELYTEQKQWQRALDTLAKIAELEKDRARRAKYCYAAAVIARDELKDDEQAVDFFTRALDDAPTTTKAFEAIERILGDRGDWKGLSRAYRTMIKRLGDEATEQQLLALWSRLAEVSHKHLADRDAAIAAYEVAAALEPGDLARHETLAGLYLEAGPDHADKAIAELQLLLRKFPDRLDIYRSLSKVYLSMGQDDKAFCLAAALVFLGQATGDERARFEAGRPKAFTLAKRRLTEELWQKAIIHPREDRALNGIFATLMPALAATTAQPRAALNLNPKEQTDPEKAPHLVARIFHYAAQTMGIAPTPELYLREGQEGIRAANVAEKGTLQPAVLIGDPYFVSAAGSVGAPTKKGERELAFDVAKKLAFFRPERYVTYALPTLPKLEAALEAVLVLAGVGGRATGETDRLVAHIRKTVPTAVLEQVAALARRLGDREAEAALKGWLTATDLTANRVGLLLANDLETAARLIATEQGVPTTMAAKDRLRDLLAYAVSEEYFTVRRHLGLDLTTGR